jgi:hypothetical protein
MAFWTTCFALVVFPALFLAIVTLVLSVGTARIARDYPAMIADPSARWHLCRRVEIGNTRLSGGVLEATADAFGLHFWPAGWCQRLGGHPFSIPWSALDGGIGERTIKGTRVVGAVLPNGQRFAADAWCFEAFVGVARVGS